MSIESNDVGLVVMPARIAAHVPRSAAFDLAYLDSARAGRSPPAEYSLLGFACGAAWSIIASTMKRAVLIVALIGSSGCVTAASLAKPNRVSLPLLIGATVADFAVTSLAASQIRDFSTAASIATGLAVTAVDVGVGCVLGGCKALRP